MREAGSQVMDDRSTSAVLHLVCCSVTTSTSRANMALARGGSDHDRSIRSRFLHLVREQIVTKMIRRQIMTSICNPISECLPGWVLVNAEHNEGVRARNQRNPPSVKLEAVAMFGGDRCRAIPCRRYCLRLAVPACFTCAICISD